MTNSKATFWDFVMSPPRNKLAAIVLGFLMVIFLLAMLLEWAAELLVDFVSTGGGWVKTWWE
jgi:hypothetical protein